VFIEFASNQENNPNKKQNDLAPESQMTRTQSFLSEQEDVQSELQFPSQPGTPMDISIQLDSVESLAQSLSVHPVQLKRLQHDEDSIYPGFTKVRSTVNQFHIGTESKTFR
jgi:hypothetical protein